MMNESNPVFVKIDKYKDILNIVEVVNKKVIGVKQLLAELEDLKDKEAEELNNWKNNLDQITHKLETMQEELTRG
jgi:Skp family chaperone for outer membrane proteins